MPEVILLRARAPVSTASPLEAFSLGVRDVAPAAPPPEPSVEMHDIPRSEVAGLSGDPSVVAVAIPMPTKLIAPIDPGASANAVGEQGQGAALPGQAWGLAAVKADASSLTGAGVTVAVLDTGIDRTHPAFAGVTLIEQDFSGSGNGDGVGHGTHCAGTIFGRDVDGTRIGIARGVTRALIGKVLDNNGSGSSGAIFNGIQWALQQNAQVISMSLGFDFPGQVARMEQSGMPTEAAVSNALETYRSNLRFFDALMQMIRAQAAFGNSAVLVAATGNESRRTFSPPYTVAASLPAAAEGVISVAALAQGGGAGFGIADFSNTMPQVAAPGKDILSAKKGGGLRLMSGTSMACPHAAGVAVLWWQALLATGQLRPAAMVTARLLATARTDAIDTAVTAADRGAGLVTAPP